LANPDHRLIVYGSLAPGESNHFLLADLHGTWQRCTIHGRLGAWFGFKAFRWDPSGPPHPAWLLHSPELPDRFPDLDAFEGQGYQRRPIQALVNGRWVWAQIYEGIDTA
jgi:gamma-glutamylcyclotransferase (GGCT)/AIG2-like uncharacterized protein YtfP